MSYMELLYDLLGRQATNPKNLSAVESMALQKLVIRNLTEIRSNLAKQNAKIEDIKITLEKHAQLLRSAKCQPGQHLENNSLRLHDLCCRDQSSSLLSETQILEDYKINRQNYQEGGDCGLAAAHAWEFFDRAHKSIVDAVLFAPSGRKRIMSKRNISPPELPLRCGHSSCEKLQGVSGCRLGQLVLSIMSMEQVIG